jgi:RimJ/RimL family protein N-acetyltransferase
MGRSSQVWSTGRVVEQVVTPSLVLRAYTERDVPQLRSAFADPQIAQWNPGPDGGEDAVDAWWAGRNDWSDETHASWAVADPSGALLGSVSVFRIDRDQGDAEIGYFVLPTARGRGIARAAVEAAAGYVFATLGVRRLELFHAVENTGSCRVANAARFTLEGTLRQSHRYSDGVWHDEHLHARLRSD